MAALYIAVFATAAAVVARDRRRQAVLWAGFGAVIGPVALLLLLLAPPGRCSTCGSRVSGWLWVCGFCGNPVEAPSPDDTADARPAPASLGVAAGGGAPGRQGPPPVAPASVLQPPVAPVRSAATPPAPPPQPDVPVAAAPALEQPPRVLASAVLVTGAAPLLPGCRYQLEVTAEALRVVGPVDQAPGRVAVTAILAAVDATALSGRVVITEMAGTTPRLIGSFMSIAGREPDDLAELLVREAGNALARADA